MNARVRELLGEIARLNSLNEQLERDLDDLRAANVRLGRANEEVSEKIAELWRLVAPEESRGITLRLASPSCVERTIEVER